MLTANRTTQNIRDTVNDAWGRADKLQPDDWIKLEPELAAGLAALDNGSLRVAEKIEGCWTIHEWIRRMLLLYFRAKPARRIEHGEYLAFDKFEQKFSGWDEQQFRNSRVRVVPGAHVRYGAYVGPGVILMPSFINVGAHIGTDTLIDTWATVGSCAQIGERCHISGGVGIGGVLEPANQRPVIIEDDVFIGARSEIAEGVTVGRGSAIAMGVFLGQSTPIIDRHSGETMFGNVPPFSVVVPGAKPDSVRPEISTSAAIIVKKADASTRAKIALNPLVRD